MSSNSADEQRVRVWRNQQPMIFGGRQRHGSARIDENRMIIVGGQDEGGNILSSGFIYDVRTQQSTPLRNDMPAALSYCCVVMNGGYVYVIGGDCNGRYHNGHGLPCLPVNTVYRLCLESEEWSIMAPMATARIEFAAVVKENYIYVFGGYKCRWLSSSERYCIVNNTWEELPDMPKGPRHGHCAVIATGSDIYIVGGYDTRSVEVFDTTSSLLSWKTETFLCDMPELRQYAAAVVLKKRYLVVIGGISEHTTCSIKHLLASTSCSIYDIWSNRWSLTPKPMDMINRRDHHTAVVLGGKIVVAGGYNRDNYVLASVESIDADALLEYAPEYLHYPLPDWIFDRILEIGEFEREYIPCTVFDKLKAK